MSLMMVCPSCWGNVSVPCTYCNEGSLSAGSALRQVPDRNIGPHFLLSELVASQTAVRRALSNAPSDQVIANLTELVVLLEALRTRSGPLHVDSGYRSPAVNAAVGGVATSAHTLGSAADIVPLQMTKRGLVASFLSLGLAFDQLIWEFGSWVHFGVRGPNGEQRKQQLMIFSGGEYEPLNMNDPRVVG